MFDVETIPVPASQTRIEKLLREYEAPEMKVPSNYKDPEKIAAYEAAIPAKLEEHKMKWLADKMSSDKFRLDGCRPISVSLGVCSSAGVTNIAGVASDDSLEIARFFAEYVSEFSDYKLVGFNILNFDLPIMARWMSKADVELKHKLGKWDSVDMCVFPLNRQGTMKELGDAFGLELMEEEGQEVDGSFVSTWYEKGKWDTILKYNKHDVLIEGQLYNHLRRIYDI